jgi:7-keto-8-aminopelargonate synthetase-like enzyme
MVVQVAAYLQARKHFVRAIRPPTVPVGTDRLRVCIHAHNTVAQIDALVKDLREWWDSVGVHRFGGRVISREVARL